jgi:predicted metal-dependent peptidase
VDDPGTSTAGSDEHPGAASEPAKAETDRPARRTARDREKGARFHDVIDRRRFVAAATASDLSHGRPVPPGLQEKALARLNWRALELGLVKADKTFLRTTRLYEHERGTEKLGVVELAVIVDVTGSVGPLLDRPRGQEVLGEVRRVMKQKRLRVPLDMPAGSPDNAYGEEAAWSARRRARRGSGNQA